MHSQSDVFLVKADKLDVKIYLHGFLFILRHNKSYVCKEIQTNTVELQWLEHLCDHKNMFETGVVRANERLS